MIRQLTYAFDATLSPRLARAMRMLLPEGADKPVVVAHEITCEADERDAEFEEKGMVATFAARNFILVTCLSSSRRKAVNEQIAAAGLRTVFLADSFNAHGVFLQASKLAATWEQIVRDSYRLKSGDSIVVKLR